MGQIQIQSPRCWCCYYKVTCGCASLSLATRLPSPRTTPLPIHNTHTTLTPYSPFTPPKAPLFHNVLRSVPGPQHVCVSNRVGENTKKAPPSATNPPRKSPAFWLGRAVSVDLQLRWSVETNRDPSHCLSFAFLCRASFVHTDANAAVAKERKRKRRHHAQADNIGAVRRTLNRHDNCGPVCAGKCTHSRPQACTGGWKEYGMNISRLMRQLLHRFNASCQAVL